MTKMRGISFLMLSVAVMLAACSAATGDDKDAAGGQEDLGSTDGVGGEDGGECVPDCAGRFCGDDGCGGKCGTCYSPEGAADDSLCLANGKCCVPACTGKKCGDNGCGGVCGECTGGGQCVEGKCTGGCTPDCFGKECGDDGCGDVCGVCYDSSGAVDDGLCTTEGICCSPKCAGKECGSDGCGGSCGDCEPGLGCQGGTCVEVCQPQCEGKECGYDGCTGTCGTCQGGYVCNAGKCEKCTPACQGKECGSDGCGGLCGTCDKGFTCKSGQCECVPQCKDKQCGDDSCGGSCGECDDGNPCTTDSCAAEGKCEFTLLPLDEILDTGECLCSVDEDCEGLEDGDICNGTLLCDTELEVPVCMVDDETIPDCEEDDNACTTVACDPVEGCVWNNDDDNECFDSDPCNGIELCKDGECLAGEELVCDDENPCTDDVCIVDEGCLPTDNDNNACADSNLCNGVEYCEAGECKAGEELDCDDENPCTDDSCDPATGCVNTNNDANSCLDLTICNGLEVCDKGECKAGEPLECDDGKPCTDDSCDPVSGCVNEANDSNACFDEDLCDGTESCSAGDCVDGEPLECDDANLCTDDSCIPATGCSNIANDANACIDQTVCNGEEYCDNGECKAGLPLECDDNKPCTDDSCHPDTGCANVDNDSNDCADGNLCNGTEYCEAGECKAGEALECDDSKPCTDDSCIPATGCSFIADDANSCLDNTVCNGEEACAAGECEAGEPLDCTDTDSCTADSCHPVDGCLNVNVPVNCVMSDWSSWSSCTVECGGGTRTRTRTVDVAAACGGVACPNELEQTEPCNTQFCPCVYEPLKNGDFSSFSVVGSNCAIDPMACDLLVEDWEKSDFVSIMGAGHNPPSVTALPMFGQPNVLGLYGAVDPEEQGMISQIVTPCHSELYKRLEFTALPGGETPLTLLLKVGGQVVYTETLTIPYAADYVDYAFNLTELNKYPAVPVTIEIRNPTTVPTPIYIGDVELVLADLVINEVDYDQPGADTGEFIEILNVSDQPVSLAGLTFEFINGSNLAKTVFQLGTIAAELEPGGYIVLGNTDIVTGLTVLKMTIPANSLQNDNEGVRLMRGKLYIDGLAWEGPMPTMIPEGQKNPGDPGSGVGSLARCPNGFDSDANATDFVLVSSLSPGFANICE